MKYMMILQLSVAILFLFWMTNTILTCQYSGWRTTLINSNINSKHQIRYTSEFFLASIIYQQWRMFPRIQKPRSKYIKRPNNLRIRSLKLNLLSFTILFMVTPINHLKSRENNNHHTINWTNISKRNRNSIWQINFKMKLLLQLLWLLLEINESWQPHHWNCMNRWYLNGWACWVPC